MNDQSNFVYRVYYNRDEIKRAKSAQDVDHFTELVGLKLPAKIDTLTSGMQLINIMEYSPKAVELTNNLKQRITKKMRAKF